MPLVQLVDAEDVDPEAAPTLDSGRAQYGMVLDTWRALLQRPSIFATYLPYVRAVAGPGEVPQRTKDLVGVQVGLLNHCRYTTSHRIRAARASGVTDGELSALADGRLSTFPAAERVALEFAGQLTLRPPTVGYRESPQAVDAELLTDLRATFSDPQIVELTAHIGLWNGLARFHRVMAFELDMEPPPPALDEVL